MGRKPKAGSRAWEESRVDSPTYAKNTILDLARRAEGGSKEAVENLRLWLEKYPDMRSLIRELDGLATKVERAWVHRPCGADELSRKAVEDDLAAMKAELLGPAPSVADKILAGTVLVAHLGCQRAALAASVPTDKPEVRAVREKLLSAAQRRLQDALKGVGAARREEGPGAATAGQAQAVRARRGCVGGGALHTRVSRVGSRSRSRHPEAAGRGGGDLARTGLEKGPADELD